MRASARCLAACVLRARYDSLLASGALQPDAAQAACVQRLSRLHAELGAHHAAVAEHERAVAVHAAAREAQLQRLLSEAERATATAPPTPPPPAARDWFAGILWPAAPPTPAGIDRVALEAAATAAVGPPPAPPPAPRGVYLFGGVGVGKTLMMDLLFDAAVGSVGAAHARRLHFNAFSNAVHWHLHRLSRQEPQSNGAKHAARAALLAARRRRWVAATAAEEAAASNAAVLSDVADALLPGVRSPAVLCFDEFEVTDAFTAVALKGVLEALLARGVTLVLTSNRAPRDMHGGAAQQRTLFEAFAATLEQRCEAWPVASATDYRAVAASQHGPSRLCFSSTDMVAMDALHEAACAGEPPEPQTVPVLFGRELHIARACAGVARTTFEYLCSRPLGAADYIALAERFHTIFLDGVPAMSAGAADVARRFITLVDELYNARCVLVLASDAPPAELFAGRGSGDDAAPLVDLESLQFEGAPENARSRRDVAVDGGVAPVATTPVAMRGAVAALSGAAERFAFARSLSRLAEMGTSGWVRRSRAPALLQQTLLRSLD